MYNATKQIALLIGCTILCLFSSHSDEFEITSPQSMLAPVYGPLAEWLVDRYRLDANEGIGIDIGGGKGDLVIELCKRTQHMYWVNVDIEASVFHHFFQMVATAGVGHRAGGLRADVHRLPFRDEYADMIVSRGSFFQWRDKQQAFAEIYRVLKPGGIAYIGRGFSENLPVSVAREIRARQETQKSFPRYDARQTAEEFHALMRNLQIQSYTVIIPSPPGRGDIGYGVWIEIKKE